MLYRWVCRNSVSCDVVLCSQAEIAETNLRTGTDPEGRTATKISMGFEGLK
jgi:hypothetical protein